MIPLAVIVASCAFAFAFGFACIRVGTLLAEIVNTLVGRKLAVDERLATVEERRMDLDELARKPKPPAQPMPSDLRNRIGMLDEEWARDEEERRLFTLYAELDDWDKVRRELRPLSPLMDSRTVDHPFVSPTDGFSG